MVTKTKVFYDSSYKELGLGAQRRYPNEEFCRFIGSNWLNSTTKDDRSNLRLLEVGSGAGANIWMAVRECFDAYGLELSEEGINVCREMLKSYGVSADVRQGDMTDIPYEDNFFDIVCDILSACCLDHTQFQCFLKEVSRVLKPHGHFFFYTFSTNSDAFSNHSPAILIDKYTLNGVFRETSPYYGNLYPIRFMNPDEASSILGDAGFSIKSLETIGRTYRSRKEYFEYISCTAVKV